MRTISLPYLPGKAALPVAHLELNPNNHSKMHILSPLTILALTRLSTALPPLLLLPSNTSSLSPLAINATAMSSWPKGPWVFDLHPWGTLTIVVTIEHYGRRVCSEDDDCEIRVIDAIYGLLGIAQREYVSGRNREDSFTWDVANLWIQQTMAVSGRIIEELIRVMIQLTWAHGTTEVAHAGLIFRGRLAATFILTYPGVQN